MQEDNLNRDAGWGKAKTNNRQGHPIDLAGTVLQPT